MSADITFRTVQHAASYAAQRHERQLRKDKKTPYVAHVFRVCLIVRDLFGFDDPKMLCAALLHDTVEDTKTDFDDLAEEFSPEIAHWVALLTKDKRLEEKEREEAYLRGLQSAPWQVKVCKVADVYDNLVDMVHLPAERRPHTLERLKHYLDGLSQSSPPELMKPLEIAWNIWHERTGK